MKELFFLVAGGVVVVGVAGWALYMVGKALTQVFRDWRLGKELDEIESQSSSRREERRLANEQRLAMGCEHDFCSGAVGLPPAVCVKCGLAKDKPSGGCDHVWRVKQGPVPSSACEKCDKLYSPIAQPVAAQGRR